MILRNLLLGICCVFSQMVRSLSEMCVIVSGSVSLFLVMPASVKVDDSGCNVMFARVSQLMTPKMARTVSLSVEVEISMLFAKVLF